MDRCTVNSGSGSFDGTGVSEWVGGGHVRGEGMGKKVIEWRKERVVWGHC